MLSPSMSVNKTVVAWLWLLAFVPALQAAPADDHARGLAAMQRGDVATAMAALRPAAQAGHAPSQSLLGYILDRADFSADAARLWQAAAVQGDAEAHAGLANLYLSGRGLAKDEKRALQHFSEAALRGHAASVETVALAWIKGEMGADAKAEPAAARAAVLRAAEAGHAASAEALVSAYQVGRYGLPVDADLSSHWRAKLAAQRAQRLAVGTPALRLP